MSKKTSNKKPQKRTRFSITEASPDDPIYTRGFVVGGKYTKGSLKKEKSDDLSSKFKKK